MDIVYWPVLDILLWGFFSIYLNKLQLGGFNAVTVLLGVIILWDLLSQSQRAISVSFLEDVWERNLLNLFVTPLRVTEFLIAAVLVGMIRIVMVTLVMGILAAVFYQFNLLTFGFNLIPFVINLLIFGWTLGIFTISIILRFGTSAQIFAFGLMTLIQPFSAVFYPVSALPESLRFISYILPSTHIFEGMRGVVSTGAFPAGQLFWAFATNILYLVLVCWLFYRMFARVKERGALMKLEG